MSVKVAPRAGRLLFPRAVTFLNLNEVEASSPQGMAPEKIRPTPRDASPDLPQESAVHFPTYESLGKVP